MENPPTKYVNVDNIIIVANETVSDGTSAGTQNMNNFTPDLTADEGGFINYTSLDPRATLDSKKDQRPTISTKILKIPRLSEYEQTINSSPPRRMDTITDSAKSF